MMKSLSRWFADRSAPKGRPAIRSRRARVGLEPLESRMVLSTYTVNSLLDVSPPPGDTTLRQAIIAANNDNNTDPMHPDIINVTVDGTISLSSSLPTLTGSVSIQGPGASSLTIQGDGKSDTILNLASTASASLSGLTLTSPANNNAGISVSKGASLTIQNDLLRNLLTNANGGAILNNDGNVTVSQSTFLQDLSNFYGAAIANQGGSLSISQSTFNTCFALNADGGAVYNSDDSAGDVGQLTVLDDTFVNNTAENFGGAIGLDLGSTSTVVDSTFTENESFLGGGGISLHARATTGPQISLRLSGSTVTNNTTLGPGFGSVGGGGIYVQPMSLDLPVLLHDTIIAGNTVNNGNSGIAPNDVTGAVDPTSSYNLIGDGSAITGLNASSNGNLIGTDANPVNARLGPLQNNGGPTQTIAPLPNSPAIDQGGPDPVGDDYTTTDQASDPRIVIQPYSVLPVGGDGRDVGAFELATQTPTILTVNSTADANPPVGVLTLRQAIEAANGTLSLSTLPASQVQVGSPSIDEIRFAVTGTIALASALPTISMGDSVSLEGPGASSLTIQGDGLFDSIVNVAANASFTLAGLTFDGDQSKNTGISIGADSVLGVQNADIRNAGTNNDGSAVFSQGGFVTVASSTIQGGFAAEDGAGIAGLGGSIGVFDCVFQDNTSILGNGGAIDANYGSGNSSVVPGALTVVDSTFTNNTSASPTGGGAFFLGNGSVTSITESTFAGNSADGRGGAVFTSNSSTLTIVCSTLNGNSDDGNGTGGIEVDPSSDVTLIDTILAGNFAKNSPGTPSDVTGTLQSTSVDNIIGDGSHTNLTNGSNGNLVGTDVQPINVRLGPLGNYGGPTPTIPLLPGSPAIDAGSNALAANANGSPLTTDQRGEPRTVNSTVDIGAFESQGFTFTPVNASTPQSAIVGSAFANSLDVIVTANNPVEPVNGGVVNFTATPASNGASATLSARSAVIAAGQAGVNATTNGYAGSYSVTASASGVPSGTLFQLANQADLTAFQLGWGSVGRLIFLYTAADGVRLLPTGRSNDLPWLDVNSFTITLNTPAALTAADVSITGITVADYGPVTITGSGATYTIRLAEPINAADRVTLTINAPNIATYTRRLDILPGDVDDLGVVNAQDVAIERDQYLNLPIPNLPLYVFGDVLGLGTVYVDDYNAVRARVGTKLPPLP
jgi:hypothetical protein